MKGRRRRWPWIVLAVLALLVCLTAWAVTQVPTWVRDKASSELSRLLERPVTLTQVELGLFPPRVQIKGFKILEKQGAKASFSMESVSTEIDWASVSKKYPFIKSLKIVRPELDLTRYADGQTSVDDLIKKFNERPKSDNLPQFSIANIELEQGAIKLQDDTVKSQHGISELNAKLPFLSSLTVDQKVWVKPALSLKLDGRLIEAQAESLPFEGTRSSRLKVIIEPFELAPWLAYWPKTAVVAPLKARLQSAVSIDFAQTGKTHLLITGSIKLADVALKQALQTVVFDRMDVQAEALALDAFELQPLEKKFKGQGIVLTRPVVNLVRPSASAVKVLKPAVTAKEAPVQFDWALGEVKVIDGQIAYQDPAFLPKPLSVKLKGINGAITGLGVDSSVATEVKASAQSDRGELLKVDGQFSKEGKRSQLAWDVDKASLSDWWWLVEPYLVSTPKGGVFKASGQVGFGGDRPASLEQVQASIGEFKLKSKSGLEWLKLASLKFSDVQLDLETRTFALKRMEAQKLQLLTKRNAQNELSFRELIPKLDPKEAHKEAHKVAAHSDQKAPAVSWTIRLDELKLDRAVFELSDEAKGRDTDLKFEDLKLLVKNLHLNTGASFVAAAPRAAPAKTQSKGAAGTIDLSASLNQKGRISLQGPMQLQPIQAKLDVDIKDINVLPFQSYFTSFINAVVTQGEVGAQGKLAVDLASENPVQYLGAVEVNEFASVTKAANEDLLKWKRLRLTSTEINTKPLKIDLGDIALDEFYSRLIISPTGRFNLQDLGAPKPESATTVANAAKETQAPGQPGTLQPGTLQPGQVGAPTSESSRPGTPQAPQLNEGPTNVPPIESASQSSPASPPSSGASAAAPPPVAGPPPVRIGKITLNKGNIDFSDFFVKPNYSANLTNMAGSITELTPEKAGQVTLTGRIDGTGTLKIEGAINPLIRNLFLDLKADATDIDLPRLTPYSGKYMGYGIEKGKLSAKVAYKLENRQLKAENRVILDQLTFGEKVDSPTATKLPILFAVALLKDRNGVIDIDMPIGGSLDDPKFSVSGLVLRMIGNLIVKVITSPFSLLASLGGGKQQELSKVEFEDGHATLSKTAQEKLEAVAKALTDRPALKLDLGGRASLAEDAPTLKKRAFDRLLKAQKLRETLKGNVGADAIDAVEISTAEYPKYLTQAFQASSLPKPRNLIGVQKAVPVQDMEKALSETVQVSDTDVLNLANRRAQALKDWLAETGKITTDRLFITAPKLEGAPRVELSLK